MIAASGSLARYIKDINTNDFFQEFVPEAAAVVYEYYFIF
jgi:hypothetical protein